MSILSLLITIALVGFVVWLILQIPMPDAFRNVILGIVVLVLVLYVLQVFGIHTGMPMLRLR